MNRSLILKEHKSSRIKWNFLYKMNVEFLSNVNLVKRKKNDDELFDVLWNMLFVLY